MINDNEIYYWLRSFQVSDLFPREVGRKSGDGGIPRIIVDEVDFWNFLNDGVIDIYGNIFSQRQKTIRLYDTILIDVDYHMGSLREQIVRSYNCMKNVGEMLDDVGLKYRLYFTGRGFHFFVDFKPTRLEFYPKVIRKFIVNDVFNGNVPDCVDMRVLGDRNRIARIPGSVHSKTDLYMIRVDDSWDLGDIIDCSKNGGCELDFYDSVNKGLHVLEDYDVEFRERYGSNDFRNVDINVDLSMLKNFNNLPPCIKDGIKRLVETGELEHLYRLHLASYLLRIWDYEDVVEIFKYASDFKDRLTRYHLNYILEHDLWPLSCKSAVKHGICPYGKNYKSCPFYDLSGGWLGLLFMGGDENGKDS